MVVTKRARRRRPPTVLECGTAEEVLQRRAYDHLREHGRETLAVVEEMVRVGGSDDEIVEHFTRQTGREDWELTHVGLAAGYARRLLEINDVGGVH